MTINSFSGQYSFLSNFCAVGVTWRNVLLPTSEHCFVAAKTLKEPDGLVDDEIYKTLLGMSPGQAKRFGRTWLELPEWWEDEKLGVMEEILRAKFSGTLLKELQATRPHELIEGNQWHDNFWGSCWCSSCKDKEHENHLGKLLMKIRDETELISVLAQ